MTATEAQVAWAAGIFEGEGCIHIGATAVGLMINMTDEDVLRRFAAVVGVGRVRGPFQGQKPSHKPHWEWRAMSQADREFVLRAFLPWLGTRRRDKAEQMLALPRVFRGQSWKTHCKRGHPLDGPESDVRVRLTKAGGPERRCRVCHRERSAAYKARLRGQRTESTAGTGQVSA